MTDPIAATADFDPPKERDNPIARLKADPWMLALIAGGFAALIVTALVPSKLMGLPAHPLLLHMPVIFVPCLSIAAIVFAIRADWRKTYGIAYGIGAIVTGFGTLVAAQTGEAYLHDKTGLSEGQAPSAAVAASPDYQALQHHASLGGDTKVVVSLFVAIILIQILIDRRIVPKVSAFFSDSRSWPAIALATVTGLFAVAATVFVMLVGHAGAKITFGHEERGLRETGMGYARPGQPPQGVPDGDAR